MKRKTVITLLLTLCAMMLAGCAKSPDEVKIDSTKKIRAYAKEKYGKASSYEVSEGEND